MAEALRVDVPDGMVTFCFGPDKSFTTDTFDLEDDLLDMNIAFRKEGKTQRELTKAVQAFVLDKFKVELNRGYAECLQIKATEGSAAKKKSCNDAIKKIVSSANSMVSAVSDLD